MILTLLLGQSHLCRAVYVTSEGRDCSSCASTLVSGGAALKARGAEAAAGSKDCRACCKLTCREAAQAKTTFVAAATHATLERAEILLPIRALIVLENVRYRVAAQYANPPPSYSDSRAPPASSV